MHVLIVHNWHLFSLLVPNAPTFTFQPDCPGLAFVDIVDQLQVGILRASSSLDMLRIRQRET